MAVTIMYWVLGAFVLAVNLFSTANAVNQARVGAPSSAARTTAALLLVRCVALLALAIFSLIRCDEPAWLIAVAAVTAGVQALDLVAALVLRSRRVLVAASIGLAASAVPLAAYVILS